MHLNEKNCNKLKLQEGFSDKTKFKVALQNIDKFTVNLNFSLLYFFKKKKLPWLHSTKIFEAFHSGHRIRV